MKKLLVVFILVAVAFASGWITARVFFPAQVITKKEVEYNTIYRGTSSIPCQRARDELSCYYTSLPALDIESGSGNDYNLSASLCERKWQRRITLKPRDSPRNIIITGVIINTRGGVGAWGQYYRFYGPLGYGGGVIVLRDEVEALGGVAWLF